MDLSKLPDPWPTSVLEETPVFRECDIEKEAGQLNFAGLSSGTMIVMAKKYGGGIYRIGKTPAETQRNRTNVYLKKHKKAITKLIRRATRKEEESEEDETQDEAQEEESEEDEAQDEAKEEDENDAIRRRFARKTKAELIEIILQLKTLNE